MPKDYFQFKQFLVRQDRTAMKVTTDSCLFGAFAASGHYPSDVRVLDLGTGTGLLALMFAQKNPGAIIDAIEIDAEAAAQAMENIAESPWKNLFKLIHADARNYPFNASYDVVVCNPPFYDQELKSTDERRNRALHGSDLSLEESISVIKAALVEKGKFYLLMPVKRQKDAEEILLRQQLIVTEKIMLRQSLQHDPFRIIYVGTNKGEENPRLQINEMKIWQAGNDYSEEFVNLLKDYYLYL